MTATQPRPASSAGLDGPLADALIGAGKFFSKAPVTADNRAVFKEGGRGDWFYRDRWAYDKVVRSTHGVNCTGSCSWKVYVKDGIITWEAQQTDYPSAGPDKPEYEPRGCPRGAAFSWYTYSPTRVRYPYIRGVLMDMYRQAKAEHGDPVVAWASIVQDPEKAKRYKSARGKGGLVRATWDEAIEMVAAAQVYTIKRWGPDRIAGFSPIPAMSMVSHASGARYTSLIGGSMLSFYDWYADLPVASPQVFGDQTDVPESGDWWDAGYLIMWGSNVPLTRTPDAHWMTEARYRGQKVVVMAPDYAENVKFADEWLPVAPGTDAALGMAMGHVVLKEFFVDRQVPYFEEYTRAYTDLPFLVTLDAVGSDAAGQVVFRPGKNLVAGDFDNPEADSENAMFKPALWDAATNAPAIPNGTLGHRFGDEGLGKWNLDLGDLRPELTLLGEESVEVELPLFDSPDGTPTTVRRGVPVRRVGDKLVTTVFDLMLAQYGVGRPGLPGTWPTGYGDETGAYTPAWQEMITNVPAAQVERVAREFAQNAEDTNGRSMILMGAGTNHWYHSDLIYRTMLMLTTITGCQGRNGGGWAHYVGQEKARPITGWAQMAFGLDWSRPPRQMIQTGYWYINTDQWRYDTFTADELGAGDAGNGQFKGKVTADLYAQSARSGWMPSYPTFDRNPLVLGDAVKASGQEVGRYVADALKSGELKFAVEDPDAEENWPRVLMLWRANLFGNSAKGDEYFLKHLLGTDHAVSAAESPEHLRPKDIVWRPEAPQGKLDHGIHVAETIMALAGTTNGHLAVQGFKTLEKRTGQKMHDLAAEHEGKIITFNEIVGQPTPVITSPEWSGSESGGRRYSPFTINVERLKPWHTLTGRQHFYLDHDWMNALGEMLPTYRGPLNMTQLFGETPLGETNELGVSVRYLTPHFKWAIHSQYQDNWFMQNLSRGGQQVWMSVQDAEKVGIADNDWIELVNRNGVVAARAIVSHRMPEGTVYMYHSQDRLIDVPLTETNNRRGGIHNSMTRILIKPSHIIGGYAQLAFAFNYLGPTGNNRDEVTMLRKRTAPLAY